jgi:hypothetical protein
MLCPSRSVRALRLFGAEEEGVAEEKGVDSCRGGAIIGISGGVLVLRTEEF